MRSAGKHNNWRHNLYTIYNSSASSEDDSVFGQESRLVENFNQDTRLHIVFFLKLHDSTSLEKFKVLFPRFVYYTVAGCNLSDFSARIVKVQEIELLRKKITDFGSVNYEVSGPKINCAKLS
ncbi:hypothetical protein ACLB2K_063599 [Fragaria x ananassa]